MSPLSQLSCGLRDCYKSDAISSLFSENMQSELAVNSLVLNCSQLDPREIPCLVRFLSGKEAISYIETLIIISKPANKELRSIKKGTKYVNALNNDDDHPILRSFPDKLFKAVTLFISRSLTLHTVVIDSVNIKPDLLQDFAEALSSTKSVMRWLSFKHCALGSKGVRVLGPHISKMSLQVLVFERCGLCDDCCPAISSILKRQEAILDTLFWNVTLRSHTTAISSIETAKQSEESDFVFSEGLVALSLNGNNITEVGIGYLRSAIHSNHWFLGLNLANNKIGEEGITMLVKSLKNNDALHTVLLGGNPGFTVELAQSISRITSKSPLRLRYMPKGVAILLERWIKLQLTERTGGVILQDLSVTVIDRRFLGIAQNHGNNSQHEIDILDIHRSHTGDVIDFQNIDHDVKNIFMVEECSAKIWEPSVATAVGIGKEIGVKPDTSIIDNNIKTQHSIEWGTIKALDTEIPEDNFLSERSWYEEGSDVLNRCSEEQEPYLDNILHLEDESSLPHNDSPKGLTGSPVEYSSSSFGIALNNQEKETKRNRSNPPASAAASSHVSVQAPNQEGNKNIGSAYATSDEPYKRNSPVFFREDVQEKDNKGLRFGNYAEEDDWIGGGIEGGGGDGAVSGVGGRVEGWTGTGTGDRSKDRFLTSKVHNYFNKAIRSNSTERKRNHSKEVESPSPRHLADSGNFNFNISRNSRGGYSRDKGTTGATGSPINGMGQTPQSITPQSVLHSSDRGQGQGIGVEQRRGQGRGRRQGKEHGQGQGQGEYKKQSSPIFLIRSIHSHSESTIRYPLHRHQHIDDAHDSSDHGSPNYRHTEEDRMTSSATRKNKKTSKNSNTKKSKKRNQDLIIPNRSALSIIRHTALEHAMSCFSDSVKEVTESLGTVCEQLRDVTSSLSESLSELNKSHIRSPLSSALPTHNTHNSPSIIPGLGPVLIPIPLAVAGLGNKLAGVLDFDAKKSNNLIPLGETFGRSRGSLMHRDDEIKNEVKNEFKRDESSRNDVSHRGYYEGVPDVGTVKRSTLQKVHALLEERESTDRGSNTSSTLTSSANPQKTLSRTKSSRSSTLTTTERDRGKEKDGIEDDMKNDLSIDNESEIEIIRDSIRNTESVASQNQNQNSNRVHSPLRDSSTSEDTSFNYSKFSRPKLGPKNKNPSQNSDLMPGGDHITQADMVAFIKERLHRKLHAVLRPL